MYVADQPNSWTSSASVFRRKTDGQAILLVEQHARMAVALADRAYVLQHGHVILQGNASDLAADPVAGKVYPGAA